MERTATASHLQLFAVTSTGPRALAVPAGGTSVHELLEELPSGVYSALRTFGHDRFLWLDLHFERTERSMRGLGWTGALDRASLRRALGETARAYPLVDSRVRFDVLREPFELQGASARCFIALSPFVPVPAEFLADGVRVELAPHLHRRDPRIKTTAFVRERRPLPLSTRESYEHVLLDEEGCVLEGSSSNIAFVRGRELVSAGSGVLEGITLKVVEHLAPSLNLVRVDERLRTSELARVDEAFLCSSSRGIVPIVDFAGTRIANSRVGPLTRALTAAYYALAEREARPA